MGRPNHPLWKLFDTIVERTEGKPHPDVWCSHCGEELINARPSQNMLQHTLQCLSTSEESKTEWRKMDAKVRAARANKLTGRIVTPNKASPSKRTQTPTPRKRLFRTPSSSENGKSRRSPTMARMTKTQREQEVALAFYATGVFFRVVENPQFKRLFDYDLSPRKQLATRLLDDLYIREKNRVCEKLKDKRHLGIVSDGWTNGNSDSVVNFVVVRLNMKPIFWTSVTAADCSLTGEYIADLLDTVIREVKEVAGKEAATSVVTNNASNMKAAWQALQRKHPMPFCTGCAAHGTDLLMKDLFKIKEMYAILDKCKTVTRFLKRHCTLWSRFRQLQKDLHGQKNARARHLSLPVPRRWYSSEICIRNVVINRNVVMMVLSDAEELRKKYSARQEQSKQLETTQETCLTSLTRRPPEPVGTMHPPMDLQTLDTFRAIPPTAQLPRMFPQLQAEPVPSHQRLQPHQDSYSQDEGVTALASQVAASLCAQQRHDRGLGSPSRALHLSPPLGLIETCHPSPSSEVQLPSAQMLNPQQEPKSWVIPSFPISQHDEHMGALQQQRGPPPTSGENGQEEPKTPRPSNVSVVLRIIQDEQFWRDGEMVLKLIRPINKYIALFERDNCSISIAHQLLTELTGNAVYNDKTPSVSMVLQHNLRQVLEKRQAMICTEVVKIAHFLDPSKPIDDFVEGDLTELITNATKMASQHKLLAGTSQQDVYNALTHFGIFKREKMQDSSQESLKFDH